MIVPQVLYEYWDVAIRLLENNGLGLDAAGAERTMGEWTRTFPLLLIEKGDRYRSCFILSVPVLFVSSNVRIAASADNRHRELTPVNSPEEYRRLIRYAHRMDGYGRGRNWSFHVEPSGDNNVSIVQSRN